MGILGTILFNQSGQFSVYTNAYRAIGSCGFKIEDRSHNGHKDNLVQGNGQAKIELEDLDPENILVLGADYIGRGIV